MFTVVMRSNSNIVQLLLDSDVNCDINAVDKKSNLNVISLATVTHQIEICKILASHVHQQNKNNKEQKIWFCFLFYLTINKIQNVYSTKHYFAFNLHFTFLTHITKIILKVMQIHFLFNTSKKYHYKRIMWELYFCFAFCILMF